jgi:hypothetical protein
VSERLATHVADDRFCEAGSFGGDAIFHKWWLEASGWWMLIGGRQPTS